MNIHLECRNMRCGHTGVVDAKDACTYFKLHRWADTLDWTALDHFRCTACGDKAGRARPTENKVTVTGFFPLDPKGWHMLQRRLRS